MQNFQLNFCTCHACRHQWLLPFYTISSDLDFGWGSQSQCKSKPSWLFSRTFQLIRIKFDEVLNILILLLSEVCWKKGQKCCFIDCTIVLISSVLRADCPVLFLVMNSLWICVMSNVRPYSWTDRELLSVLYSKNFNFGCNMQTFQPNFLIPAMIIGARDVSHFLSCSVTLTLTGCHKVSRNQNLLASISRTLFNWSG